MALVIADRVRETTTTTGTGTITLAGAVNGYQAFSVVGNANTTYYCIAHQTANEWEVGVGTYTLSGTTLARTTVLASSNAGSAVNFSAGTKDVFCTNASSTSVVTGKGNTWSTGDQVFGSTATDSVRVGIGTNSVSGYTLKISKNAVGDGGNNAIAVGTTAAIQSDVTNNYTSFEANPSKASGFTTSNLFQFSALGSSVAQVSNYYGFYQPSVTAPTNIYAAYFNIGAGSGGTFLTRWNLYIPGTANNYLAGNIGIGTNALGNGEYTVRNTRNMTGNATSYGYSGEHSIQPDVTTAAYGFRTQLSTVSSAFTVPNLYCYSAQQGSKGATSTITNQYGFHVSALTIATNNYGFYGGVASATGAYNFYAGGTADNWFSGNVFIGGAGGLGYTTGSGGAVTQATSRTTSVTLNKTNGAITLVSAAGSTSWQSFAVNNSTVAPTDVVILSQKSGTDSYMLFVTNVGTGGFTITYATTGGTTTEQPVFNFAVIKAVTA